MNFCGRTVLYAMGIMFVLWLISSVRQKQAPEQPDDSVVIDSDMEDAASCLVGLGIGPDDAADRVIEARKQFPEGDINILVNTAIRL